MTTVYCTCAQTSKHTYTVASLLAVQMRFGGLEQGLPCLLIQWCVFAPKYAWCEVRGGEWLAWLGVSIEELTLDLSIPLPLCLLSSVNTL